MFNCKKKLVLEHAIFIPLQIGTFFVQKYRNRNAIYYYLYQHVLYNVLDKFMTLTDNDIEQIAQKATALFKEGYNCTQSVTGAWAGYYNVPAELMAKISSSFGGGIGRMRETCGAACGMFILAGLETGSTDPKDQAGKGANYKAVQELAAKFKECNGSINCGELLGMREIKEDKITHEPQARNAEYYKKRPCVEIVASAARIYGRFLAERLQRDNQD